MITTEQVKALRMETGVSIMQCKKALEEAEGDRERAIIILRKKSSGVAAKKSDRKLLAGVVQSYIHNNHQVGAVVVLSCETDFVAKNKEFVQLAYDIAMHVAAQAPDYFSREDIDASAITKAKEVFLREIQGKPENLQEQILSGKIDAYFKDKILLEQSFIKDNDRTIGDLINEGTQKFGERIELASFARYAVR